MRERVIGYDTRIDPAQSDDGWTPGRKAQFLLRHDARPLSVDEAVWLRRDSSLVHGEGITIETPRFSSLAEARDGRVDGDWLIAITVWEGGREADLGSMDADPDTADTAWERLGWDVMDGMFPSGLSNCGYEESERQQLVVSWAERLNRWHLFDDLPSAFAFRDVTARRASEHGPFSVMGIYRIPE
jgi:hypothetical protein